MAGTTPRELAAEFGMFRRLRPGLKRAVFHASLSSSPNDRSLSDGDWQAVAARFANELGYADAPFVVIRHTLTDHEHVHILAARVDKKGKTITDAHDFRRAETILREIERDYGLTPVSPSRAALPQQQNQRRKPMDEKTKKVIEERLARSADDAEAQLHAMQGHDVISAQCVDAFSERELREQRRFAESTQFEQQLRSVLNDEIKHIHHTPRGLVIYTTDGGRLHHQTADNKLVCYKTDPKTASKRMVAIATLLGWQAASFRGSPEFVREAFLEAMAHGIRVVPVDAEQEAILLAILAKGKSGAVTLTPHPAPSAAPLPVPVPTPRPAPAPSAPEIALPSPFGSDIQAKLDARRREQEERGRYQPIKTGGPKAP